MRTAKEYLAALREMGSEKTTGTGGLPLPAEFYKVFWKDISSTLISALNYAYEIGKLSITQRRSIIKLIPKKRMMQNLFYKELETPNPSEQ